MKKILTLIAMIAIGTSLTACGSKGEKIDFDKYDALFNSSDAEISDSKAKDGKTVYTLIMESAKGDKTLIFTQSAKDSTLMLYGDMSYIIINTGGSDYEERLSSGSCIIDYDSLKKSDIEDNKCSSTSINMLKDAKESFKKYFDKNDITGKGLDMYARELVEKRK